MSRLIPWAVGEQSFVCPLTGSTYQFHHDPEDFSNKWLTVTEPGGKPVRHALNGSGAHMNTWLIEPPRKVVVPGAKPVLAKVEVSNTREAQPGDANEKLPRPKVVDGD